MSEQRYRAVLAVIAEGHTVTEVAARFGVSRQTMHAWLAKYEAGGLENLGDGSHRRRSMLDGQGVRQPRGLGCSNDNTDTDCGSEKRQVDPGTLPFQVRN